MTLWESVRGGGLCQTAEEVQRSEPDGQSGGKLSRRTNKERWKDNKFTTAHATERSLTVPPPPALQWKHTGFNPVGAPTTLAANAAAAV